MVMTEICQNTFAHILVILAHNAYTRAHTKTVRLYSIFVTLQCYVAAPGVLFILFVMALSVCSCL